MEKYRELIKTLTNCIIACEYCATSCLEEENVKQMKACIQLDRDCADICSLAVQFLARESQKSTAVIRLCADICAECAKECEKHDHVHCVECSQACRECEKSCKDYLNQ